MKRHAKTPTTETVRRPTPKWLNQAQSKSCDTKVHENRIARNLGGRRQPASGATMWSRWIRKTAGGDVTTPVFHIEHKRTQHQSLAVKHSWLERVVEEARARGRIPALAITFEQGRVRYDWPASQRVPADWILLPLAVVQKLIEEQDDGDASQDDRGSAEESTASSPTTSGPPVQVP